MSINLISLIFSGCALSLSGLTAWLTLLRRGQVMMTRPSTIFFGEDGVERTRGGPKIYLRTLLFCTSKRGRIIESLYVSLHHNESRQNFNIWVLGDDKLSRGSGLFVPEQGLASNHHFLLPPEAMRSFEFQEGMYEIRVHAKLVHEAQSRVLFQHLLTLDRHLAESLQEPNKGVYFDWGPDAQRYIPHVSERAPSRLHEAVLESLRASAQDL